MNIIKTASYLKSQEAQKRKVTPSRLNRKVVTSQNGQIPQQPVSPVQPPAQSPAPVQPPAQPGISPQAQDFQAWIPVKAKLTNAVKQQIVSKEWLSRNPEAVTAPPFAALQSKFGITVSITQVMDGYGIMVGQGGGGDLVATLKHQGNPTWQINTVAVEVASEIAELLKGKVAPNDVLAIL